MGDVTREKVDMLQKMLPDDYEEIEGYIFQKANGSWVAGFMSLDGTVGICSVTHCPFCGANLRVLSKHKC